MTKKSMSTLFTALFLLLAEAALILLLSYPVIRPGEVYSPDLKNGFDIFAGPAWDNFPIRQEADGQPVMLFRRIDLGARPDDMDLYSFIAHSSGYDTDTVAGLYTSILKPGDRFTASRYSCWYSMMPSQAGMDTLLALAGSVGPENSEKVCEFPRKG